MFVSMFLCRSSSGTYFVSLSFIYSVCFGLIGFWLRLGTDSYSGGGGGGGGGWRNELTVMVYPMWKGVSRVSHYESSVLRLTSAGSVVLECCMGSF